MKMNAARAAVILLLGVMLVPGFACDGDGAEPTPKPTTSTKPTPTPTATATLSPTPTPLPDIRIHFIKWEDRLALFFESGEYVSIQNYGDEYLNLFGWELVDLTDGYPTFTFPHYILKPGYTVRVYTNQKHEDWGGLTFAWDEPIWNNSHPDVAALYDAQGRLVSTRSYTID